jgi:glycosyltransferase involved in cell wall biosynthesis
MILFDYKIFFLQKYGGISRYIIELSKKLKENNIDNLIQTLIHKNIYLRDNDVAKGKNFYLNEFPKYTRKIINYLNNYNFESKTKDEKYKIFHNTYYSNYKLNPKINKITTVYDFTHEIFSKEFDYKKVIKKKSIMNSDHIICISENTKNDLLKYYDIDEKKVSVVYLGGDHLPKPKIFSNPKPYILYVGFRDKYKNFDLLLSSIGQSKKLKNDIEIICYGNVPFTKNELYKIDSFGLSDKVKHINGNDQLLADLYNSAKCHVITSKYEGFGITAIEAYNFDCPVLCNNNSSLKEIAFEKNIFDGSSENLTYLLEKVIYSHDYRLDLIKKGNEFKNKFNWQNCYNDTVKVYKRFNI